LKISGISPWNGIPWAAAWNSQLEEFSAGRAFIRAMARRYVATSSADNLAMSFRTRTAPLPRR
jgi:hypothetical protein